MFAQIFRELKYTFRLSVPIAVGLIGQGLFGVIDTLMVGNMLGEHALAAATLANNVNYVPQVVVVGLCSAIPVLTAQARGAGKDAAVPGVLRHGLLVCLGFSLVGAALVCAFSLFDGLTALGQPENVAADAKIFSCIIALSVPAAAGFQAVKSFRDASGGQWISLLWIALGLLANIFLNWALMTGAFFFPNWGLEGAAAGTLFSRIFSFLGITFHERLRCEFREASIAANQVAITISSLVYMCPLGISQALSIRIGEAFGQKDLPRIRTVFFGAALFTMALMGFVALVQIYFRQQIPALFNLGETASLLAENILLVAAAYMIFDAFQTVAAGALRGLGDVRVIAGAAFVSYWIVGCPTALILAFPLGLGGVGVWIGLATGLALSALILGARMHKNLFRRRVFI